MLGYERRQIGWALVAVGVVQVVVGLGVFFANQVAGLAITVIGLLTPWLFATLTVRVDDAEVRFWFGPGLVRRRVPLADIRAIRVVTLPWYSGVGIHFTLNGMLYNVAFGPVVQLELENGRRINIGSPEPDVLCGAIREHAGERRLTSEPVPHAHGVPWPLVSALLVACVAMLVSALVIWNGQRPVTTTVEADAFTASGAGYSTTIATRDIVALSLRDDLPAVQQRTNGYAFGSRLRGAFVVDGLGRAHLYLDRKLPPFLVVQSPTVTVVVNASSPDRTRDLFDRLRHVLPPR